MASGDRPGSLQDFVGATPDLVDHFFNETLSPHVSGRRTKAPVPLEWSNWRDEQRAWRETAILFDQSHHMPQMWVRGPDAFRFLNRIGVNSFSKFEPGKAKQFVGCSPSGHMIGECVIYYHEADAFELVSGMHFQNWIQFQAETCGQDVRIERDLATADNPGQRSKFRFGMDGPHAERVFRDVVEGAAPEIPFFNFRKVRIAGCDVVALRHGMAGHKGVELSGRYEDAEIVRAALLAAGRKHGLRAGGTIAYFSTGAESGWIGYPVPAVFTDEAMRPYREWLAADSWEVRVQLGGSYRAASIADYYVTPWDMGYDRLVNFDHDFIGREALQRMAGEKRRTAVSLVWNKDDLEGIFRSAFEPGLPAKQINYPIAHYAFQHHDMVQNGRGEMIGVSVYSAYSVNEREMIALAILDRDHAEPGTEVTLIWGEPDGGSRKPQVERHRQAAVRAVVAPKPYARTVQELKLATIDRSADGGRALASGR